MRRTIKIILWLLGGLLLLALLALIFVQVYNRFDDPLTPEAQALVASRPVPGVPDGNAFFMLLGMRAPAGKDAMAVGVALDKLNFEAFSNTPMLSDPPEEAVALGGPPMKVQRIDALRCNWFEKDCLAQFRDQREAIDKFGAEQSELFDRYQRALAMPDYRDRPLQSYNEPAPVLALFNDMDALAQARALYACEQGDAVAALEQVRRVTTFSRRVMANTTSLVIKLVFAQVLRNNLALLNALMRQYPVPMAQQAQALTALALPLTLAESGLEKTVDAEVALLARNLMFTDSAHGLALNQEGQGAGGRLMGALIDGAYKRNATANFLASRKPFFSLESQWLRKQKGLDEKSVNTHTRWPSGVFWNDYVDNPVGRILVAIGTPDLGVYTDRMMDVDGYERLTALHVQIFTGRIADADIPAFVEGQDPRYLDPYTGKPMQWDAAKRTLVFQGHGRASSSGPADGRFTVAVAPLPPAQ